MAEQNEQQNEQQPDPAHGTDRPAAQSPGPAEPMPTEPVPAEPGAVEAGPADSGSTGPASPEPPSGDPRAETPAAGQAAPGPASGRGAVPGPDEPEFDEQAAWEAIVAGYGEEPPDPPGIKPFKSVEDLALLEPDRSEGWDGTGGRGRSERARPGKEDTEDDDTAEGKASDPEKPGGAASRPGRPLGGSVSFAPGVGPRDYSPPAAPDDEDDEGHFVPPEPPPLPAADATAKFGWLAVLGGPLLLLLAVLLGWQMTWWLTTLGIGGFIGGFVTLVIRMNPGDDEDDDPGRGAVV